MKANEQRYKAGWISFVSKYSQQIKRETHRNQKSIREKIGQGKGGRGWPDNRRPVASPRDPPLLTCQARTLTTRHSLLLPEPGKKLPLQFVRQANRRLRLGRLIIPTGALLAAPAFGPHMLVAGAATAGVVVLRFGGRANSGVRDEDLIGAVGRRGFRVAYIARAFFFFFLLAWSCAHLLP